MLIFLLGWTKKSVRLNAVSVDKTDIFLPTWSQDFDLTAIETTMEKNRDYFVDIDDVRSYINRKCSRKKGIVRARTPATPEDGELSNLILKCVHTFRCIDASTNKFVEF